ncbi:MAG: flagellar export chaperone FliS [Georgenia sp.]
MNQVALLNRFKADTVATATPAKLLTMLYDRLVLDLDRGIAAIEAADAGAVDTHLSHAQNIVQELRASLDVDAWDGAQGLKDLYSYLVSELVGAHLAQDVARVTACRDLLVPLRDAWHEAAATTTVTGTSAAATAAAAAARPGGDQPTGDLGVA